jgi:phosphoribosylglycinamide formyltransferase-1
MTEGRPTAPERGKLRIAIVASTGGSVMNELLKQPTFHRHIAAVVADRECGALTKAAAHGVPAVLLAERKAAAFCDRLLAYLRAERIDYVLSFYTKLFVGPLLEAYRDRIINMHPSLLPSFKGLNGFEDSLRAGVRFGGTSIHVVDERMDEGKLILQSVFPIDPDEPEPRLRHRVFEQQCRSLLQVVHWLAAGRIYIEGAHVRVAGARFDSLEFAPALDSPEALNLRISFPEEHRNADPQ